MYKKSYYLVCFALAMALAGVAQGAALAPDDGSVKDNLSLWLRNPGVNFDEASGIWVDVSGNAHDAEPVGEVSARGATFVGPTLSSGSNPAVFGGEFTTVKFAGDVDDLLRATNLNGGVGLSELTIFAVYSVSNIDQSGVDATRPVGIGSFQGEGANLGDNFNLSIDVTIRKDNGFVSGATATHPEDLFFIRVARMNGSAIDQWFNTDGVLEQVHSGGGPVFTTSTDIFYLGDLRGGVTDSYYSYTDIEIAEAVVYNTALTDAQIERVSEWLQANLSEGGGPPLAAKPNPADGALLESTWVNISWRPGYYAVSHDVYIGENFDDVNDGAEGTFQGNQAGTFLVVGFPGFPYPDGLVPGTTYYWRIDEVNDTEPNSPWKGDIWSFTVPPKTAYNPEPTDVAKFIDPNVELSWTAGFGAKLHHVYFGDNFDDVNNAVGGLPQANAAYTLSTLELDKVYYWRIDEFDGAATQKGDVWSFKTRPVIPITDPNLVGWWKLDEGMGITALDWSGHGNHGILFGPEWTIPGLLSDAALNFGGSDYVAIQNLSYNSTGNTGVTVCAWIRTSSGVNQFIASFDRDNYWRLEINGNGGGPGQVGWDVMTSSGQVDYGSSTRVDDGLWHHVTGVFDNGRLTIYIDGRPEAPASGGNTFGSGNLRYGFIGANSEASVFNGNRGSGSSIFGDIDEMHIYDKALTVEEILQVMRGDPLLAWDPKPSNGSTPNIRDASPLSWSPGDNASEHDVYFGTDRDAVANADETDTTGTYRGRQGVTTYNPPEGVEWGGGPYYWRIDEYNTDATISKGSVWSFTVADYLTVDDFEDYDTGENQIWYAWKDGLGYGTPGTEPYAPGNGTGSAVGDDTTGSYTEETIVHGGGKSMPFWYDNSVFRYSEAQKTLTYPRDWTEEGVGVLSLWFYGDASNAAEPLYVALNGSAVVTHDNPNAAQIDIWTEWTIDLQAFADQGVNLANVNTLAIGFGNRNNPQVGGSGKMYFDDIRLYRPAP